MDSFVKWLFDLTNTELLFLALGIVAVWFVLGHCSVIVSRWYRGKLHCAGIPVKGPLTPQDRLFFTSVGPIGLVLVLVVVITDNSKPAQ